MAERLSIVIETLNAEQAKRELDRFSKAGITATVVADKVGKETAQTATQMSVMAAETNKATAAVRGFGASGFIAVGTALTFGYALARSMREAAQESRAFGRASAEVSTLLAGTADEVRGLEAASLSLAATFGGSATAQVNAYYQAYSAGAGSAAAAQRDLIAANKLAVGGVADLIDSTSLIASVTNAYGRENYTATQASDLFFLSVRNGITTIPELGGYLANVTPVAAAFGVSLEEVSASVASLTASGTRTRIAVTQIRALILSLQRATPEVQAFGAALGINLSPEGLSEEGGFARVITQLQSALSGLDQAAQGSVLRGLFGVEIEALSAAASLAGGGFDNFTKTLEQAGNAAGLTDEAFQKISGTLENRYEVSLAKSNAAVIAIGDEINNRLIPILELKAGLLTIVSDNTELFGAVLVGVASIAVAALTLALYKLAASVAVATGGVSVLLGLAAAFTLGFGTLFYATAEATDGIDRHTEAQQALALAFDGATQAQERQTAALKAHDAIAFNASYEAARLEIENLKKARDDLLLEAEGIRNGFLNGTLELADFLLYPDEAVKSLLKLNAAAGEAIADNVISPVFDAIKGGTLYKRLAEILPNIAQELSEAIGFGDDDVILGSEQLEHLLDDALRNAEQDIREAEARAERIRREFAGGAVHQLLTGQLGIASQTDRRLLQDADLYPQGEKGEEELNNIRNRLALLKVQLKDEQRVYDTLLTQYNSLQGGSDFGFVGSNLEIASTEQRISNNFASQSILLIAEALAILGIELNKKPDKPPKIDYGEELKGVTSLTEGVRTLGDAFNDDLRSGIQSFSQTFAEGLSGSYDDWESFNQAILETWKSTFTQLIATNLSNSLTIGAGLGGLNRSGEVSANVFGTIGDRLSGAFGARQASDFALTAAGSAALGGNSFLYPAAGAAAHGAGAGFLPTLFAKGGGLGQAVAGLSTLGALTGFGAAALAIPAIVGKTRTTGGGFDVNIGGDGVTGDRFETTRTNGLIGLADFLRNGTRNRRNEFDLTGLESLGIQRAVRPINLLADNIEETLGVTFDSVAVSGKDAVEVAAAYGEAIANQDSSVKEFRTEGENLIVTLERLAAASRDTDNAFREAGFTDGFTRDNYVTNLLQGLGGIPNLGSLGNRRTEAQVQADAQATIDRELDPFGYSAGQFSTVSGIDTEAARLSRQIGQVAEAQAQLVRNAEGDPVARAQALRNQSAAVDPLVRQFVRLLSVRDEAELVDPLDPSRNSNRGTGGARVDVNDFATLADFRYAQGIERNSRQETEQEKTNRLLETKLDALIAVVGDGNEETAGKIEDFLTAQTRAQINA